MRNHESWWTSIYNGTMLTLIQNKDQMYPFTNFQGKITLGTRALLSSVPILSPCPPFSHIHFTLPVSDGQAERLLRQLLPPTKTHIQDRDN